MSHKIALPVQELRPALTGLGKIVSKRATLPVLTYIKIERTKDGWTTLTSTDLDVFITYRLEQPSEGEAVNLLVPYDELVKITKSCQKADTILIRSEENQSGASVNVEYAIGNQVAEAKLSSIPVAEFPEIPRIKGDPVPVDDSLRQSIHEALDCASRDETRLVLNSAYIDVSNENGHYVVGTNGSHLYSSNSFKLPLKESFILPTHKFLGFGEFNKDGGWQLRVHTPQHKDDVPWFQLSTRRWRFIDRQIEGHFPNWRQVVPNDSSFLTAIQFEEPNALADTIERLPDHDERNHAVGIERISNTVYVLWKSDKAEPWKRLEVNHDRLKGADNKTYVNRHYLIKALRFGLGRLQLTDATSPMRFSNEGRQMIVMPVQPDRPVIPTSAALTEARQEPAAPSPAAQPERKQMPRTASSTNGNGHQPPPATTETKPALELALEQIETIKGSYREAIRGLNDLGDTLKQVQREHKTVQSVRLTLEKLQTVRI